jgi:purine-binding chemotaxis protein CheW
MIVFRIGEEEFATDINIAKEIVVMRPITPIPETRDFVEGVMNLRGNLIPVLDLRKRLRAARADGHQQVRIIIATLDGKQTGLIVDGATEVIRVSDDMIEPVPDVIRETGAEYLLGVINMGNRFITMLDLEKVLMGEVRHELDEVMRALAKPAGGILEEAGV